MSSSLRGLLTGILTAGCAVGILHAAFAGAGGSVGVTSDYVLRGVTQSDGEPALQGELHWNFPGGWSSGIWASQLRFAPAHASLELGAHVQWYDTLSDDFIFGASLAHYGYPDDPRLISYDYDELSASLDWRDQLYAAVSWTPRINLYSAAGGLARDRPVLSIESSWHRNLRPRLDLNAGLGFYKPQGLDYASYGYGDVTLGWHSGHWRAHLARIWVQSAAHRQYSAGPAGGPWALTLTWGF